MNRRWLLLLCSGFAAAAALAQTTVQVSPPKAPPVTTPQPGTAYDIQIDYPQKSSANGGSPANSTPAVPTAISIRCEYGSNLNHTVVQWSDGTKWDGYILGSTVVQVNPKSGEISSRSTHDDDYLSPYFVTSFPGSAWITLNQYQGVTKVAGQTCNTYVRPSGPSTFSEGALLPELDAWINSETGVPVRITLGDAVFNYSATRRIESTVPVPPAVSKYLQRVEQEEATLEILRKNSR